MDVVRGFINLFQFNRTNWKAMALCFSAAIVFWLFASFNKTQSATFRFPLHFEYDQLNYAAVSQLPQYIQLQVTGSGWSLVRKTFKLKETPLTIPIDRPGEIKKIVASSLSPLLIPQLNGLEISYLATDTLYIDIDKKVEKDFILSLDLKELIFKKGCEITNIEINPPAVTLLGPRRLVNEIPDTIVLHAGRKLVDKSFTQEIEVPLSANEIIQSNPKTIRVNITVSENQIDSVKKN
jgi:YbbR domain-containing protein